MSRPGGKIRIQLCKIICVTEWELYSKTASREIPIPSPLPQSNASGTSPWKNSIMNEICLCAPPTSFFILHPLCLLMSPPPLRYWTPLLLPYYLKFTFTHNHYIPLWCTHHKNFPSVLMTSFSITIPIPSVLWYQSTLGRKQCNVANLYYFLLTWSGWIHFSQESNCMLNT